jgi:hypothetical protein
MGAFFFAAVAASIAVSPAPPPDDAAPATASGASGSFTLPTAFALPDGKARLGFGMDWWRGGNFLLPDATSQRTGAALSGATGFLGFIEAYGALSLRSTNLFSEASRRTLTSFGDADLGVKLLVPGQGPFSAGVLLQLDLPSGVGGFSLKGAGGRAAALFGWQGAAFRVPLAISALAGYRIDNSGNLVTGTPATLPAFALALSSYDVAMGGLSLSVPLGFGAPGAEIVLESPVGRQKALPIGERPLRARLSLGVLRLHTDRIPQLGLSAAVQFSLSRDGRIAELMLPAPGFSPDPPWTVLAGLSWTFDRPALPRRAREVQWHEPTAVQQPSPPPPVRARVQRAVLRVVVQDGRTQLPLAGAWVSFLEGSDVGGTTGPDGRVRVETDAGTVTLAVAKDGYELLTERISLLAGEEKERTVALQPVAPDATVRGRIAGEDGLPLRATVLISVAGTLPALPGAGGSEPQVFEGSYNLPLQHGTWELNASAPGYRCTPQQIQLRPGETASRDLELRRIAGEPRARLSADGVELGGTVSFRGAAVDASSHGLLLDLAQALKGEKRTLHVIARVGPKDTLEDEAQAVQLSEARARAVIDFLVSRGVRADLLLPRGVGFAREGQPLLELRVAASGPRAQLERIPMMMEVSRDP